MIVVIADDMTGAAELGGVGLRYGLRVRVSAIVSCLPETDLLVCYANTRSMTQQDAVTKMTQMTKEATALRPSLFYKKIDSVLRGHVLAEIRSQMQVMGSERALIVPVNPQLERTIIKGNYFVQGQPIHETGFSSDPEFPISSSDVKDMLGSADIHIAAKHAAIEGISIGEAETMNDVEAWAASDLDKTLLAGGASFFSSLLASRFGLIDERSRVELFEPLLLVTGTRFQKSRNRLDAFEHLVTYVPTAVLNKSKSDSLQIGSAADAVVEILSMYGRGVLAIAEDDARFDPALICDGLSEVASLVMKRIKVHELLIEGGSTAFSITQKMELGSFTPTHELEQGVVRMQADSMKDLNITIKPGSYDWPSEWRFT